MNLKINKSIFRLQKPPLIACVLTDSDVFALNGHSIDTADIIELRIDMFDDISINHVEETLRTAKDKFNKPLITTVRNTREGGQKEVPNRLSLYKAALPMSEFFDVEVNSEGLLTQVKDVIDDKTLLIGSYHNFQYTPDEAVLDSIVSKGRTLGAEIIKVAVTAKDRNDLIRLLLFTLKHRDSGVITMCMGDEGLPSRIISPVFGSLIAYGYINKPSAPGQLSILQLSEIFRLLNIR